MYFTEKVREQEYRTKSIAGHASTKDLSNTQNDFIESLTSLNYFGNKIYRKTLFEVQLQYPPFSFFHVRFRKIQ